MSPQQRSTLSLIASMSHFGENNEVALSNLMLSMRCFGTKGIHGLEAQSRWAELRSPIARWLDDFARMGFIREASPNGVPHIYMTQLGFDIAAHCR